MGRHDGKDNKDDDRPAARTGKGLCEEFGHGAHIHFGAPKEDPQEAGKWYAKWQCRRCKGHGVQEVAKP